MYHKQIISPGVNGTASGFNGFIILAWAWVCIWGHLSEWGICSTGYVVPGCVDLGKFFRCRRRRRCRRPRTLLFRQFLANIICFKRFSWHTDFWDIHSQECSLSRIIFCRRLYPVSFPKQLAVGVLAVLLRGALKCKSKRPSCRLALSIAKMRSKWNLPSKRRAKFKK